MSWAVKTIERLLRQVWSADTGHSISWSPSRPSQGQCVVTSLKVQDLLGGEIERIKVGGTSHYYNRIADRVLDLTADQFDEDIEYDGKIIERDKLLGNRSTRRRYSFLSDAMDPTLTAALPTKKISHVVIRDPNYVAGNRNKPEVKVFAQSTQGRRPLNPDKLAARQKVYMKWSGGPIVAESKILSWHEATFEDGDVNEARELTMGTMLFGLDDYWASVQAKARGRCGVVRLTDEQWLKRPLYASARSRGSSWIYLDTLEKQIRWLSLEFDPAPSASDARGRSIPAGIRFKVLLRDNFTCRYCGRRAPDVTLHVDHLVPWKDVREHKIENLLAACQDDNLGKGAKRMGEDIIQRFLDENRGMMS